MSITNTNTVAKVAAVVAGLGLVAMSFASFAPAKAATTADLNAQLQALLAQVASLQAQLGQSQGASVTFSRDLTIGSTGADVTALQNWLISKGESIPAGATGFFGSQTQAAVAAWQAANGITPAAGFFGPITRAKVNAMGGSSMSGGTSTGGVSLSGGEASLTKYKFVAENGILREGDTKALVATAQFDVKDGDADVQRVDFEVQASNNSLETKPWKYIKTVTLWDGSKKLASVDASTQDAWDDTAADSDHTASAAKFYKISLTGFHDVVKEGDTANLTISVDGQANIDAANDAQTFVTDIPTNGIRAMDSAGINQYTGAVGDTVTLDISAAQNGKLTISEDSSDPDAGTLVADTDNTSSDYTILVFKAKNTQNVDTKITDLTFTIATGTHNTTTMVRRATLSIDGHSYTGDINTAGNIAFTDMSAIVPANDSLTGTLKVSLYSDSTVTYSSDSLTASLSHSDVTAESASTGDSVSTSDITGTASGNTQSIVVSGGITVAGSSMTAAQTYNSTTPTSSYGTFTLKYTVTAVGDDVYVPKTIDTTANTSGHTASTTNAGAVIDTAMSASTTDSVVTTSLSTTASSDNTYFYVVHAGDTETFTATVVVNPLGLSSALTNFQVGLDKVKFSTTDANLNSLQTLDVDQTDSQFHTDTLTIAG
jgi:peptidoglycan hydrolase-like protein with peptidoglycan-binding domain